MAAKPQLIKCLVWDLDNTLWQGTLLEDPEVRIPDEIRQVISTLDSRGILQSVASKNDYDPAWKRLEDSGSPNISFIRRSAGDVSPMR